MIDLDIDTFAGAVERTTIERANLRAKVGFAETMLQLIRESAADEKIRAIAAGAIETLKEMP